MICREVNREDAGLRRGPDVDRLRRAESALVAVYSRHVRALALTLRKALTRLGPSPKASDIAKAIAWAKRATKPDARELSVAWNEHAAKVGRITAERVSALIDKALPRLDHADETKAERRRRVARSIKAAANDAPLLEIDRAWAQSQSEILGRVRFELAESMAADLREAIEKGRSVSEIEALLLERQQSYMRRAELIGESETQTLGAYQSEERMSAAGINAYRWQTQQDDDVRDEHKALQGKVLTWDSSEPEAPPGSRPNCRCYAIPVIDPNMLEEE